MKSEIFRKSSLERVSSPEQLNDYIKVSNPSVWLVIFALFILLAAAGIWAFTGNLPTKISSPGLFVSTNAGSVDSVICYLTEDQVSSTQKDQSNTTIPAIKVGQKVEVSPKGTDPKKEGYISGTVTSVAATPKTASQVAQEINNEWTVNALRLQQGYVFEVVVKLDKKSTANKLNNVNQGDICNISVTTQAVKPADFIFS